MRKTINQYLSLNKNIINLLIAGFFVNIIGVSLFLILNIFLSKKGFNDVQIANYISYRFLAITFFALPFGLFIKKRKLKPFFYIGGIGVPATTGLLVFSINNIELHSLIPYIFLLIGLFFSFFQICKLPYIIRNAKKSNYSHAISLSFATHSISTITSGFLIFLIDNLFNLNEGQIINIICISSIIGIYFIHKIKEDRISDTTKEIQVNNWRRIIKAISPTLMISIGAGLAIPFMNLFFFHSFKIDSDTFSFLGSCSSIIVAIFVLNVPKLKNKFGYKKGILSTQSMAIICLIVLATTDYFTTSYWALPTAIFFFLIRQPLMNMAGPMTEELSMEYVGKKNQEILSALYSAVWSGSWFFSSQIFRFLRSKDFSYGEIFYITAALYAVGVFMYYILIKDYNKTRKNIN